MKLSDSVRLAWLDDPHALESVRAEELAGHLDLPHADACRVFAERGFWVSPGLVPETLTAPAAQVPRDVLAALAGCPRDQAIRALQDCFRQHACLREVMTYPPLLDWCDLLLGARALPYQTLSLPESSQQGAHSDEILMSSEPRGGMIAAWIALEDVHADAGPLQVWPGSHRWDYVSAAELGITATADEAERGRLFDTRYYEVVRAAIERRGAQAEPMILHRGDVLFWHQSLIHGAQAILRPGATRNSLIIHYFADGARPFSDLYGRGCTLPGLR